MDIDVEQAAQDAEPVLGNTPTFPHIDDGKSYDSAILDVIVPEAGATYVMDRGFLEFARPHRLTAAAAFFVIRAKSTLSCRRLYSRPVDKTTGVQCDQTIALTARHSIARYPDRLRRVRYRDPETGKRPVFRWIKQNLRIKSFFGFGENAVRTQIWIAVTVYVLVAIIKKRLQLEASLYTILQSLSVTLFEKIPLDQLLANLQSTHDDHLDSNQLKLLLN